MKNIIKNNKGFTLIELIVVIVILGILAAVAIPRVTGAITSSRINTVKTNIETVKNAINASYAANGQLPAQAGTNGATNIDPLLSGRTLVSMGVSYVYTAGAASYELDVAAGGAPYSLATSDVNATNFPVPYDVSSTPTVKLTSITP